MSEKTAIKKLIDTMMEIDQLKRELKEKEKQREELITILTEGTFETGIKAIQGKGYKQYRNNEYNPDNIIETLKSRTYNYSDWQYNDDGDSK